MKKTSDNEVFKILDNAQKKYKEYEDINNILDLNNNDNIVYNDSNWDHPLSIVIE